jgi:membrane associated rhomboid family serine protease
MLIPYNVDVPMQRWPIANWVLIAVTVVVSCMLWGSEGSLLSAAVWPDEEFSATQLVTYLFAHADIFHLAGNMLFLFVFGNAVNAKLGHVLYLLLYGVTGVVAALAWMATDDGLLIGASGAIMGVVGAFLVYYPRNDVSVAYWFGFIAAGTFSLSSYWMILMYVAFDLWGVLRQGDGVAYISHLVGAGSGFGIATLLLATKLVRPSETEQTLFQAVRGTDTRTTGRPVPRATSGPVLRPPPSSRPSQDDAPIPLVGDPEPVIQPTRTPAPPSQQRVPQPPRRPG